MKNSDATTPPARPRRRTLRALAAFALFFVCFFPQAVFGGKFLISGDAFYYSYPMRTVAWEMIRAGQLPLWTPHILSGFPLLAMQQLGLGYPLTWLYAFLPGHWAEQVYVLAPYLLAPAFTYAYCRGLGRSRAASALAGLAFAYGGAMCGGISNSGMLTNGMTWLPLVLLATEHARRAGSSFALCLCGGAAAYSMSVLNGHAQTFVYAGATFLAYGLFLSLFTRAPRDSDASEAARRVASLRTFRRWRPFAVAVGAVALGAGVAAFQLFETAQAARLSTRRALTYETFGEGSFKFAESFRALAAPLHALADVTPYAAPLALALAAFACVAAARDRGARDVRVFFWLGAAAAAWLLMLGENTPLQRALFHVPALNRFRVPSRHAFEWTFGVSVLAAYGWDRLDAVFARRRATAAGGARGVAGSGTRRDAAARGGTPGRVAVALLVAAAAAMAALWWRAVDVEPAPTSRFDTGLAESAYLVWKLAFTALLLAAAWLAWRLGGERWRAGALAACVALGLFVEPNFFVRRKWGLLTLDAERFTAVSHATLMLRERPPEEGRVYTRVDLYVEEFTHAPRLEAPHLTALHGLHSAAGVEPLISERYSRALGGVGPDSVNPRAGFPDNLWLFSPRSRVLDLLNVTHVVAFSGLRKSPDPPAVRDGLDFAREDLQITLAPGARAELPAPDAVADSLVLVSSLANSVEVEQGAEVGKIVLHLADGRAVERHLRAGADTAEWAHERADVRAVIKHALAPVFESTPADAAGTFRSHRYIARVPLGAAQRVARVEIVNTSARASLALWKATLAESGNGTSTPLYAPPAANWEVAFERDDALVLRNRRALPRAWLVAEAESVDAEEALRRIRGEGAREFDPMKTALLEVGPEELPRLAGVADPAQQGSASSNGSARVVGYEPNRIVIETESPADALLVVSEMFYPGWEARVDGGSATIFRANYLLRAVRVPAGRHRVEMRYRAPAARRGALVSSLTLLVLGVLTFTALRRKRRPAEASERPD